MSKQIQESKYTQPIVSWGDEIFLNTPSDDIIDMIILTWNTPPGAFVREKGFTTLGERFGDTFNDLLYSIIWHYCEGGL